MLGTSGALTGTVRVVLLDTTKYTYRDDDAFLSDIPSAAWVAFSKPLQGKTFANGVFDADDVVLTRVPDGPQISALVVYVEGGSSKASRLVLYIEQVNGLPVTPDGTDVEIHWNELGIAVL
jgi:hypothetical protein